MEVMRRRSLEAGRREVGGKEQKVGCCFVEKGCLNVLFTGWFLFGLKSCKSMAAFIENWIVAEF